VAEGREIEFPPGSGHKAFYEPHELKVMERLTEQMKSGHISKEVYKNQIFWLHGLKVRLGARVLTDEEALAYFDYEPIAPEPTPEEPSDAPLFQIPPEATRRSHDPFA
jgi:hypothetical protein